MSEWDAGAAFYSDQDLLSFDADLPSLLRSLLADYLPLFETAAAEVLASLKMKVDMEEPKTEDVQILLTSKEDSMSMRSLGVSSIYLEAGKDIWDYYSCFAKATYVHLSCKNCKSTIDVPFHPGLVGAIVPRSCGHLPQVGEEAWPVDPWIVIPDKRQYVDQQTLKLQENPEDVPTGELPRNLLLSVDRHLFHKGAFAVRQPYIRVVGLEETNEASSRGPSAFTPEENLLDGVKLRGDINVLLLGDPSTAKSQFLKFVEKTTPITVSTSGKGSSAAGLTTSVIRDSSSMISIVKAGITTILNSRTSVLVVANPPSGRCDDLKFFSFRTVQDHIDLQTTILSRFDLIFIVKDVRMYSQDKFMYLDAVSSDSKASKEENWLKRYIQYCRVECHPGLLESTSAKLQDQYV
ncbi:hypothetical protein Patl1_14844 [Pistacia atlantica]|uniref:Uncharacterized protein n=1 Tax=Pistacia atlantica TaxID=434234 RepID=A0ACC1ARZ4_9ROSI|nr:hypothetical protein Patl1_14844 [Pistacia atlantica]